MDRNTCDYSVYAEREVVEEVFDPAIEISLEDAEKINPALHIGDIAQVELHSKEFGRIATQNAKNLILQKIREEERKAVFDQYFEKEKDIVTGIVQRYIGKNISVNLGKADAILTENEQVKGEHFEPTERIKLYIVEVKNTPKGPKILVSRTHPELVKRLFESEVAEVKDGTVEIKSIAREAGSRTKMAVWSNDPNVDPVGACVGMNGARVNAVVKELRGEKIDIINWDENPALLIENALSPAKVISVMADPDEKIAGVIVPDYQLSLAIGKEGQNARLAARLTGYKIDIKSETQAIECGDLPENYMEQMGMVGEEGYTVGEEEEEYDDVPADAADEEGVNCLAVKKKVPMRKCVGCGEMKPKKELIRILRTEEEEFVIDTTGKKNGRGAYLCPQKACFEQAVKNRGLERSFKQAIPQEVYERLEKEMDEIG